MAFWGVEVKPGKPFKLRYEDVNGRLYLAQATLGIGTSSKKSILQCKVGDGKPVFLCTLFPDKIESCPLNLEFEENDVVKFSVIGPASIHLSGVVRGAEEEGDGDDDEDEYISDPYEEDIYGMNSEESDYSASEDDPFADSEDDLYPSPARPSGVVIEEIEDDGNPATENGKTKQAKGKKNQSSETNVADKSLQIAAQGNAATPVLESEDEDGFPAPSSHRSETGTQKSEVNADAAKPESTSQKKKKQKKADSRENNASEGKSLKRKADAVVNDESKKSESIQANDSSLPTEAAPGASTKQKKKKKKKDRDGAAEEHGTLDENKSDAKEDETAQDLKAHVDNVSCPANESTSDEMKKKKKKGKNQDADGTEAEKATVIAASEKKASNPDAGAKTPKAKPAKVREYGNGLVIEELEMGRPDGKRASPGKKIKVKYIGKLKKNGEIFDSNVNRAPFQFRLGVGAVIKGWDVGVEGMRLGDKRRLTIPPQMGYGAKGAPPKIPPNSWLVFDVELVDVS